MLELIFESIGFLFKDLLEIILEIIFSIGGASKSKKKNRK